MKKLFLLDAMALIYRAHFAFAKTPRITTSGMNTSAVFGFTNTLLEVIRKENPTHLGVAFDTPKPTFRHMRFEAYKAQRQQQPEDITIAIPYVKRLCEALCIPVLILDGYEADDIIGTLAKKASAVGDFEVFMMTPDKDYGQLVEEHVKLYKPAFMGKDVEIMGPKEVCERWGITNVDQVVDLLGLMGDAVDNIPGIPGIGEKTAVKLIAEYGSVENLIANVDQLKGKMAENVRTFAEQGLLSKELALIEQNVPIEFDAEALKICEPNREMLSALLDELEFRTLRKRMLGDETPAPEPAAKVSKAKAPTAQMDLFGAAPVTEVASAEVATQWETSTVRRTVHDTVHDYQLIDTPELRQSLAHYLNVQEAICFDTETTDLSAIEAKLIGISFSYRVGEAFYVPVPTNQEEAQAIVEDFRSVFENEAVEKIAQNIKYDLTVLANYGIEVKGKLYDTMLAHYLIEPEKRHGMDILAETYLNYTPVAIEELIGKKGKNQGNMRDVDLEKIKEYAAEDADITLQLKEVLNPILKQNQKLVSLFEEVEMPLARVLSEVESEGVRLDLNFLSELSHQLDTDLRDTQQKTWELAGQEFNISSPKQLGEILFEKLHLDPKAKKTKTGQYMTGEDVLLSLESKHEIVRKILDFRELQKLKSTYVDALPALISPKTGRLHTSFNQAVTATGRLSSTNPNLQNIPIRTERGREIRKAFIPRDADHVILSADYSQIELRIMAAFSGDTSMTEAFNKGLDVHRATASKVFHVPLEEVTSDMRRKAKTVNFGIIYGVSAFGLSQQVEVSRTEAKELIDNYFREFPAVKEYMDESISKVRETGFAETILGRRRYLPNINSGNQTDRGYAERNAINAPIQGSAADIMKVAMVKVQDFIRKEKLKSRMILTVHDELVFDAHVSELEYLRERVNDLMVHALPLSVKMETGMGVGQNWLEAH
ncbi:DNA polymerase I [Siphonobacter sp. SORGH_AS_1065]|uniref:DNA polymerase I n=1 Tax=Siphonobacter sp. SORGH_AS_1065 TaxID=3041795 RepID=UPI00278709D2|nr:DNA polymerase I [Siphonobacter sp. SORGH_AS_1065]MDQ1088468.1 DNA polymerase-1 [Siphonobacter sp. SORGH_AS_1065]